MYLASEAGMKMRRRLGFVAAAGMTVGPVIVGPSARADVTAPAGLNPGDHFRLVFVTTNVIDAPSASIGNYDSVVTGEANGAGLLSYNGSSVTWQTLASTEGGATVAANRLTTSVPIY